MIEFWNGSARLRHFLPSYVKCFYFLTCSKAGRLTVCLDSQSICLIWSRGIWGITWVTKGEVFGAYARRGFGDESGITPLHSHVKQDLWRNTGSEKAQWEKNVFISSKWKHVHTQTCLFCLSLDGYFFSYVRICKYRPVLIMMWGLRLSISKAHENQSRTINVQWFQWELFRVLCRGKHQFPQSEDPSTQPHRTHQLSQSSIHM